MPRHGNGVEIGVGSGRFAAPLGIRYGIEPSEKMRALAIARGVQAVEGTAEEILFADESFDFALLVTTICFLDDAQKACAEIYRIVRKNGEVIVGFVDKNSLIGRYYEKNRNENVFYREAVFYSKGEVVSFLQQAGFHDFTFYQTIFRPLNEITAIEPVKKGFGEGSFLVIKGLK